MAKELPYFKFEPNQWDSGMIQLCSLQAKGLFIELCCLYWSRLGDLPYALALQKLCKGDATMFEELEKNGIYDLDNDNIVINFLDEQLDEFQKTSKQRSKAARKRWDKIKSNANALQINSKSNAIREEKGKGEEIRKDKINDIVVFKEENKIEIWPTFDDFWDDYDKKVGSKEKIKKKWSKLSQSVKEEIMEYIPNYKIAQPDKKFRKNPETFLNNNGWEDELIISDEKIKKQVNQFQRQQQNSQGW